MPSKPKRSCSVADCPRLVVTGRCPQHALPRPVDIRPSSTQRGYGSKWRFIRAQYLKAHSFCVVCGAPSTEPDHIIPRARGGTDVWTNLRALCHSCHSRKTALEDGSFGRMLR